MPATSTVNIPISSTGIDASGQPLPLGEADPQWRVVLGPPGFEPQPAYVVENPPSTYFKNAPNSQWIWLDAGGNAGGDYVSYTFRITFDLTDYDLSTVVLTVTKWGVDNSANVLLNGQITPYSLTGNSSANYGTGGSFTLTSGFVPGLNTLDFVVENTGGPGALNVQVSAVGAPSYNSANTREVTGTQVLVSEITEVTTSIWGACYVDVPVSLGVTSLNNPGSAIITAQVVALDTGSSTPQLPIVQNNSLAPSSPTHSFTTHVLGLYQTSSTSPWTVLVRVMAHSLAGSGSDDNSGDRERQASTWPPGTGVVVVVSSGGSK